MRFPLAVDLHHDGVDRFARVVAFELNDGETLLHLVEQVAPIALGLAQAFLRRDLRADVDVGTDPADDVRKGR